MKPNIWLAVLGLALSSVALDAARAQDDGSFFRVVSPTTTAIKAFSPDGTVVWSNAAAIGDTGQIQRATTLLGPSNWVNFAGHTVTGTVMALRLFDPKPPAGMVLIPAGINSGTNQLGAHEIYDPIYYPSNYSLTVSTFYMDATEVTKALWDDVRTWNGGNGYTDLAIGSWYGGVSHSKGSSHPVHAVTWYDCVKWCNARSQRDGRTPAYYKDAAMTQIYKTGQVLEPYVKEAANGYRLPTEAQWEYAARGGLSSRRFPWGDSDNIQHARANYNSNSSFGYDTSPTRGYNPSYTNAPLPYTSPAGSFAANGYGLYDMAGNVLEWCWDWYPRLVGSYRMVQGGGWDFYASDCRVGVHAYASPDGSINRIGFRAVLPAGQ